MKTATEIGYRQNLRRRRADVLLSEVLHKLGDRLDRDTIEEVSRALGDVLYEAGVEVLSDYRRQELGLAPRDESGWTDDEIRAWDARLLEAFLRPTAPFQPVFIKENEKA